MSDEASSDKKAKPKSRKGLILAIVGVLVLGGGGAGAWLMLSGEEAEQAEAEAAAAEKLPAQFIAMDPPFVVNFQGSSTARFLQVAVQLMTRDPELVLLIEHVSPIIRNDLLLLFGSQQVEGVSTPEGKEALRVAALEAVRKIIDAEGGKPEALEAVYFTSFVMQ
jgi:flagellar FliL protein